MRPFWVSVCVLVLQISLWAHADDERSHQLITFMPDATGANIQFDLYCGPKLGSTFMMSELMYKRFPETVEEKFDPNLLALLGKRPWIDVKCGVLLNRLSSGNLGARVTSDPKGHLEKFKEVETNALQRFRLFDEHSSPQVGEFHWLDLELIKPGRQMNTWFPVPEKNEKQPPENLLLSFRYRMSWPKGYRLSDGVVLSVETKLKVFTSNSVFLSLPPRKGQLIVDQLQKEQERIRPEEFLKHAPSNQFKLRKALYFFSLDNSSEKKAIPRGHEKK